MPCKQAVLYTGALLGNREGVLLPELLRETENPCLGSFFLDPEDIDS